GIRDKLVTGVQTCALPIYKIFLKSEGFYDGKTRKLEEGQMQVLYSRLISYYFDAQFGIRQDFSAKSNRTYATIGIEGLAPFFIRSEERRVGTGFRCRWSY